MRTAPDKSEAEPTPSKPANAKPPDIGSASVPDALAALHVNPDTGLTRAEVDVRRKENGYNKVAEKRGHPVLKFLHKFWGISAWMLELIMVLSDGTAGVLLDRLSTARMGLFRSFRGLVPVAQFGFLSQRGGSI